MQAGGFSSSSNTASSKKQLQGPADSSGYLAAGGRDQQQQHVRVLPLSTAHRESDGFSSVQGPASSGVNKQQPSAALAVTGSSGGPGQQQHRKRGKDRAPYLEQLRVLLQRTARVRRFEQMTGQHFFQLFAVAFITGTTYPGGSLRHVPVHRQGCQLDLVVLPHGMFALGHVWQRGP